mgnify:CR=1 FL=1
MRNPFGDETRLNRFLLVSVVLHAILFFAIPDLSSLFDVDVPGMAGGGVIQVMHVETSVNPRPTPVTDRLSQTTVPRVTEPRPQPETSLTEQPVAQPETPQTPEPQVEQTRPAIPEPEVAPEVEPTVPEVPEAPEVPESGSGEVLTSPHGPEVVVEPAAREVIEPPVEARPEPDQRPASTTSGSGTSTGGSSDEAGSSESGQGTAETAPAAPPPPASGRELHGAGDKPPTYPKNAEHDGVEGVVFLSIEVSAAGQLQGVILEKSAGDERLDFQAMRYIEGMWSFNGQPYDYSMAVAVIFSKEDNRFISHVEYGEVKWLNAP